MDPKPLVPASAPWFAALVALLVALGTQRLLDAVLPAGLVLVAAARDGIDAYRADPSALVPFEVAVCFLSFAVGGAIGVRMAGRLSRPLAALLAGAGVLAALFEPLPPHSLAHPLVAIPLWVLTAPAGVLAGAWVASKRRRGASA
jgi:hypothetical protein